MTKKFLLARGLVSSWLSICYLASQNLNADSKQQNFDHEKERVSITFKVSDSNTTNRSTNRSTNQSIKSARKEGINSAVECYWDREIEYKNRNSQAECQAAEGREKVVRNKVVQRMERLLLQLHMFYYHFQGNTCQ